MADNGEAWVDPQAGIVGNGLAIETIDDLYEVDLPDGFATASGMESLDQGDVEWYLIVDTRDFGLSEGEEAELGLWLAERAPGAIANLCHEWVSRRETPADTQANFSGVAHPDVAYILAKVKVRMGIDSFDQSPAEDETQ